MNPGGIAYAMEFSPDGSKLAIGFIDGSVGLWSTDDLEHPLWIESEHVEEVFGLEFTPDGTRLFSGGRDGSIHIWDTADGTEFGPLRGHSSYVYSLDISADGARLVSGSGDATVHIWESPQQDQNH